MTKLSKTYECFLSVNIIFVDLCFRPNVFSSLLLFGYEIKVLTSCSFSFLNKYCNPVIVKYEMPKRPTRKLFMYD